MSVPLAIRNESCNNGRRRPWQTAATTLRFRPMPVSKGRKKAKKRPPPPPKKDPVKEKGPSPTWYTATMFSLMGVGLLVILLNYMGLMPGDTNNTWLLLGLGGIAGGFAMTLNFR